MSLEQPTQQNYDSKPRFAQLSDVKRSGFREFSIEEIGVSEDLLHRASVELSGGPNANFLQPAADSTEDLEHDTFETDLREAPYAFQGLGATNLLLSRVTTFIRGLSRVEPDFATRGADDKFVPHSGLAAWEPNHVQLERHTIKSPISVPPQDEFYHGEDIDRVATVILPLRGQWRVEFDTNSAFNQFAALEVGKLAVVRAAGLLPGTGEFGPAYRRAHVSGSVAMILRNKLGEGSVPVEITYDRSREQRAEEALGGNVANPGWRILRALGVSSS